MSEAAADVRPAAAARATASGIVRALVLPTLAVAVVLAAIASRRPDGLSNPQFWAEDGTVWYAAAYNHGALDALRTPAGGYYQSFSRLVAAASLPFGLGRAPLVFNAAAIVAQALPALYVLSSRFAGVLPDARVRVLAALLLVGLPNSFEVQSNVTNTQTHLALLGFLIVVAAPPRTRAAAAFDLLCIAVGGLSGPTYAFLVPIAFVAWLRERTTWRTLVLAAVAATACVQTYAFLTTAQATRIQTPLGASVRRFLSIVGGHVVLAGMLGEPTQAALLRWARPESSLLWPVLGIGGLLVIGRAFVLSSSFALRALIVFGASVLAAALSSPALDAVPRWAALQLTNVGIRYWVIPTVAFLAALLWSACADPRTAGRWLARAALLAVVLVGMPLDWRVAPRPDMSFRRHVQRFAEAPPGTLVAIPITPRGWQMRLRKH